MRSLLALLSLGILILLHELGHLLVARLFGLEVPSFSVGFGPSLFKLRRGTTEYALRAVPIGASVIIQGLGSLDRGEASYAALGARRRLLVLAAGPLANYLFALALLASLYVSGTHVPVPLTVGAVEPGSEAARAQLRPGDQVVSVDGHPVAGWTAFAEAIAERAGQPVTLGLVRGGAPYTATVRPMAEPDGSGRIGVSQQYVYREHRLGESIWLAAIHTRLLLAEGAGLVARKLRGQRGVISGAAAVLRQTEDSAGSGGDAFLRVLAGLSVALALFYLLPLPSLDGGRMLLVALEAATGRRIPAKLEIALHAVGLSILAAALISVAVTDVRRVVTPPPQAAPGPAPAQEPLAAPDAGG